MLLGPSFSGLDDVRYSDDWYHTATLHSTVPYIAKLYKYGYMQDHIVHPTTLDGVVHSGLIAMTKGGSESTHAVVPTSIPNLWVSARLAAKPSTLKLHGRAERLGFRKWRQWVTAMDPATNLPLVIIDGLVGTEVNQDAADSGSASAAQSPYYCVAWKPDVSILPKAKIEATVMASGQPTPEFILTLMVEAEQLAFGYLYRCVARMDKEGIQFGVPYYARYAAWMRNMVERLTRARFSRRATP